jgi:signal transduction histidine kinase
MRYFKIAILYSIIIVVVVLGSNVLSSRFELGKYIYIEETKINQVPILKKIVSIISPEIMSENRQETSEILSSFIATAILVCVLTPLLVFPVTKLVINLSHKTSDFSASVTHELRSPLTSINMYIDLFFRGTAGSLNATQKEYLTIMKDSTKRLTAFINDLLDIAKIEQGKMTIKKQVFDLRPIILEMLNLIRPQAYEKKINLKLIIPSDLPKVLVDPDRTKQVITNLVSNAIKFTPEKGKVTVEAREAKSRYIQVSIIDTGMGIPKDKLRSVFEKFTQITEGKRQAKGSKGTGLGLTIAKGIVEKQGGKIWVESEPGKGTKFHFTLPRHR